MVKVNKLLAAVEKAQTIAIAGHIRPDGDCIGSCMGLYLYLLKNYPAKEVSVYLEEPREGFGFIKCLQDIKTVCPADAGFDLIVILDASTEDRVGVLAPVLKHASHTLCIDHHISNTGYAKENIICGEMSSASEVLFGLLEADKIDADIAAPIYMGIAHDTGVFQFSSTTAKTMETAGILMSKGIDFTGILDESFYSKSYNQNRILGYCLQNSSLFLADRCIVSKVSLKDMEAYEVTAKDLDGIVSQLRMTRGVEAAIFMYETKEKEYKVSLRSNGKVDVNKVAGCFGGGGHILAAGCTGQGTYEQVLNRLLEEIKRQLD
ncbi:MAG: DHH family phosphoesterase [Lachnospiraceae bacterium]|jgi:phosphoesterase RecJ-like protein